MSLLDQFRTSLRSWLGLEVLHSTQAEQQADIAELRNRITTLETAKRIAAVAHGNLENDFKKLEQTYSAATQAMQEQIDALSRAPVTAAKPSNEIVMPGFLPRSQRRARWEQEHRKVETSAIGKQIEDNSKIIGLKPAPAGVKP